MQEGVRYGGRPRVSWVDGLYGGLFAGMIHAGFWIVVDALVLHDMTVSEVFTAIAAPILGSTSSALGMPAVILGVCLHFMTAITFGFIYAWFAARIRLMTIVPFSGLFGITYGLFVYYVMTFLVIPILHVNNVERWWAAIIGHTLCYGFSLSEFITTAHKKDVQAELAEMAELRAQSAP